MITFITDHRVRASLSRYFMMSTIKCSRTAVQLITVPLFVRLMRCSWVSCQISTKIRLNLLLKINVFCIDLAKYYILYDQAAGYFRETGNFTIKGMLKSKLESNNKMISIYTGQFSMTAFINDTNCMDIDIPRQYNDLTFSICNLV